jgi:hypothetical protein
VIIAYIDPGAGSLLIQALIAALIYVPFMFRSTMAVAVRRTRTVLQRRSHAPLEGDETHPIG